MSEIEDDVGGSFDDMDALFGDGSETALSEGNEMNSLVPEIDVEHYMFAREDLVSFLRIVFPGKTAGANIYDKSILIEKTDEEIQGKVIYRFTFSSFGVRVEAKIASSSPSKDKLSSKPVIVEIESLAVATSCSGNHVLLYPMDQGLFAALYGGNAFLSSYFNADTAPFKANDITGIQGPTKKIDISAYLGALSLSSISKAGTSPQQRILYFTKSGAYLNSGGVLVRYAGAFPDFAFQPRAVLVLSKFFGACKDISLSTTDIHAQFTSDAYRVVLEQVPEVLPEASKTLFGSLPSKRVPLSLQTMAGIANILSSSKVEGGMLSMTLMETGARLISKGRDGTDLSNFMMGVESDEVVGSVIFSLSPLRQVVPLFKGSMNFGVYIHQDLLIFEASNLTVIISGKG